MSVILRSIPVAGVLLLSACGAMTNQNDLEVADLAGAVVEARRLIAAQQADPTKYANWLNSPDLPPALRVPGLHHASVHRDHVDLVLARNPDWEVGGRIWAEEHRPHRDEATRYPNIWFYDYTNDAEEDAGNIR